MSLRNSALYVGSVSHTRVRPRHHHLRYRMFSLLVDLDELPRVARHCRLFSHNSFNLFSFHDRDFGDGGATPLREQVEAILTSAGIPSDGPIRLFAMPRVLGHAFNPISVFFCHSADGGLRAVLYEVHNTFGERHSYLLPVSPDAGPVIRQQCDKEFHVSPFMDMRMKYRFRVKPPGDSIRIGVMSSDDTGPMIAATYAATRVSLSDASLARVFATHPLVTLKVVGAIHWEALRLWLKGVGVRSKPPPPRTLVTIGRPEFES